MRRSLFVSQDSVVLCATLRALDRLEILAPSLQGDRSLAELYPGLSETAFGALRVAVHSLTGAGWLTDPPTLDPRTTVLRWTDAGRRAMDRREHYVALADFLADFLAEEGDTWTRPWSDGQVDRFLELASAATELDLTLVVPVMLWLHEAGRLGDTGPDLPHGDLGAGMGGLLARLGWLDSSDGSWTPTGRHARAFALNFGGVLTYLPLLARLPDVYRGELTVAPDPDGTEWHVERELNLRISAAAHRRYFAESESIFLQLFDREPIEAQPKFIADMGCGDGSWLAHLHQLVAERTCRGRQLDSHPLPMVGIDPDAGARALARAKLEAIGATALTLPGDVTDPGRLAADLAERGLQIEDGLHIRAFIDHERTYLGGGDGTWAPGWTSGVYIGANGEPVSGTEIERDLILHLGRWEPYVRRHGMVVLEAHCVAPSVAFKHLGALHGIAFDAHQAYSKQYPVDHASFLRCCQEAGLQPAGHSERRYPAGRPFVSISLNRLLAPGEEEPLPGLDPAAPREDSWRPGPNVDLEDGRALHRILFTRGDIRYPALWCSPPTGFVVSATLDAIERKLASAAPGDAVRVMDYGAGTGTATIALLQACRERGFEQRVEQLGVTIELHLVDLPSSWFAQGYELLGRCTWTRFHSLRSEDGGFRPLREVTGGRSMDAVMANMVFHLIPARALGRTATGLADVLAPEGSLLWSAPDLGPPSADSVLLHDPNRALRERWLALLDEGKVERLPPALAEAVRQAREDLDDAALQAAQERAARRIRPRPLAGEVTEALGPHFAGETHSTAYEMLGEEVVEGLLVPSNQAEYLPEIADRRLREEVIRELMLNEVLPAMQAGPAGTALGLNLHWTLGRFSRRP
jgi:hypothetical protein